MSGHRSASKRSVAAAAAVALVAAAGLGACRTVDRADSTDAERPAFYVKYLSPTNALDRTILAQIELVRAEPDAPALHNDLGNLLVKKGFPKDAEREYRRAVKLDSDYVDGWFNLGLARELNGDRSAALRALRKVLRLKPGHALAHYHSGRIHETRGDDRAAIASYARAFQIDSGLLDVRSNPHIVDSKLVAEALLEIYPHLTLRARLPLRYAEAERIRAMLDEEPPAPPRRWRKRKPGAPDTAAERPPVPAPVPAPGPAAVKPAPEVVKPLAPPPAARPIVPAPSPSPAVRPAPGGESAPFIRPPGVTPPRSTGTSPAPFPTPAPVRPAPSPSPPPAPPEPAPEIIDEAPPQEEMPPPEDGEDYPYPIEIEE